MTLNTLATTIICRRGHLLARLVRSEGNTEVIQYAQRYVLTLGIAMNLLAPGATSAQTSEPAAGVALDLATARAKNISHLRYELTLSIPSTRAQPVTGTNVLRFQLADRTKPLVIDFDADGASMATVTTNGVVVPTHAINGHLVIPPARLRRGENAVRIDFRAGDAPLNRSDDLLYTWFVPANARRAIPCFDQPDLKGRPD
jgi:aminopeptidase N